MNARERFIHVMNYQVTDRPPLFEDGIREEVLKAWRKQGLGRNVQLDSLFRYDKREEIEPNLEPIPLPTRWPTTASGLERISQRLNPVDPGRLPDDWESKIIEWKKRDYPLILRVHRGYFLSLGVHGWHRFTDAVQLLVDNPGYVNQWMTTVAEFTCRLTERVLNQVEVDAVLFSEPIGGNHGPLISPKMYNDFVLNSYLPVLEVIKKFHVPIIIYRTYANTRALLPAVVRAGFNCLWACECNPQAMDYLEIRQEFGKELRLIGGIDSDSLRQNQQGIHQAIMKIVPHLLDDGGYIPLADGRVREDVDYKNYVYYRRLLESLTSNSQATIEPAPE